MDWQYMCCGWQKFHGNFVGTVVLDTGVFYKYLLYYVVVLQNQKNDNTNFFGKGVAHSSEREGRERGCVKVYLFISVTFKEPQNIKIF